MNNTELIEDLKLLKTVICDIKKRLTKKEYDAIRYEKNKASMLTKSKNYRNLHRDELNRKQRLTYYKNNHRTDDRTEYFKEYYNRNKNKRIKYHKNWYIKNKTRIKSIQQNYLKNNRQKRNNYYKNYESTKLSSDLNYKLKKYLRNRIGSAIKKDIKSGSAVKDLGCSIDELKHHLESKFVDGMTWDNYGLYGWHIDHIKPLASFNLTDRKQLLEACHYTNLQPLWAKDNLSKGDKIIDNLIKS